MADLRGRRRGRPPTGRAQHQTINDFEHSVAATLLRQRRGDLLRPVADAVTRQEVEIRSLGVYEQVLGVVDEEVS